MHTAKINDDDNKDDNNYDDDNVMMKMAMTMIISTSTLFFTKILNLYSIFTSKYIIYKHYLRT